MSMEDIQDQELIFSYNLTEGNFLVKKRRFKEAIESYSRALELTPEHEKCLTMRSKCYLLLGEHARALKDAEEALSNNPKSNRGIIQKAEALYAQGEFEYALVCFHRGKRLRPDIEEFELGIQKSAEAIENSIGEKSGLRFCRVGKVLKQLQEKQEKEIQEASLRGQKRKQTPTEQYNAKKNYGCKILLEELSADKTFMQRLIHHPELTGTCKDEIVKEATEVLDFMQTRQEFWAQQKPLYARSIQRKMAEGKTTFDEEDEQLRKRIEEKKDKIQNNHENVTKLLVNIDGALKHGSYDQALVMCASAEETIKSYNLTWLPRQQAYLGVVYSALGDAHLKLGHYQEALRWHNKDYDLSKDNPRLLHSRARALDNIGRTHATFRKYQAAIDAWEQRIPLSKSPEKRTWLFHEIGTCYKELGRYETARFYGTKCVKEARRCEQNQWIMRGLWLLADAETQLDVAESARQHYEQAIRIAEKHGFKREVKDIQRACKEAGELMNKREAEKRQAKAMYGSAGIMNTRSTFVGNVTFEEPESEEENIEEDEAQGVKPNLMASGSGDDGSSSPDITDSFDDTGSYIDWTDEDTLPPEESQEQLDVVKPDSGDGAGGGENDKDGEDGGESDDDDTAVGDGEEDDGDKTETEMSEIADDTEYDTAVADSAVDDEGAVTAAEDTEAEMVTADESNLSADDAGEAEPGADEVGADETQGNENAEEEGASENKEGEEAGLEGADAAAAHEAVEDETAAIEEQGTGHKTPAEESLEGEIPAEVAETPADETATGDETTPPVDETIPVGDDTTTAEDDTLPAEDETLPADETVTGDETAPPEDDTVPEGDDAIPAVDETIPAEDETILAGDEENPTGNEENPSGDDVTLVGDEEAQGIEESPMGEESPTRNEDIPTGDEETDTEEEDTTEGEDTTDEEESLDEELPDEEGD